jgi:hypothetical protein
VAEVEPERLLARRAELRQQIQDIIEKREELARVLLRLRGEAGYLDGLLDAWYRHGITYNRFRISGAIERSESPVGASPTPNPDRKVVAEKALEAIKEAGHPLSRRRIYDKLTQGGVHISGKNPLMVLTTMLWRSRDKLVSIPGFGYWPADTAYPPGDYYPENAFQLGLGLTRKPTVSDTKTEESSKIRKARKAE